VLDVSRNNVDVTVKCGNNTIAHAQIDIITMNKTFYELKNYDEIADPSKVKEFNAQLLRQWEVAKEFGGTHGGLIVSGRTKIPPHIKKLLEDLKIRTQQMIQRSDGSYELSVVVDAPIRAE
jgi:hypothetical protein